MVYWWSIRVQPWCIWRSCWTSVMCIDRVRCAVLVIAVTFRPLARDCFVVESLCVAVCCESGGSLVHSFACMRCAACAAVLAESGNDISPKRAISPKRVLPTVALYIVYFRSERWCRYRIWRSFRNGICGILFVGLATKPKTQQ